MSALFKSALAMPMRQEQGCSKQLVAKFCLSLMWQQTSIITVKYPRPQNVGNRYLPDTVQISEAMLLSAATARRPTEGTELPRALNQGFGVKEYHAY